MPYLLGGDALVMKQDSVYYEHFYKDMVPYRHYIPIKNDLSDLLDRLQWARDNDKEVCAVCGGIQCYRESTMVLPCIFGKL